MRTSASFSQGRISFLLLAWFLQFAVSAQSLFVYVCSSDAAKVYSDHISFMRRFEHASSNCNLWHFDLCFSFWYLHIRDIRTGWTHCYSCDSLWQHLPTAWHFHPLSWWNPADETYTYCVSLCSRKIISENGYCQNAALSSWCSCIRTENCEINCTAYLRLDTRLYTRKWHTTPALETSGNDFSYDFVASGIS